jgi:hypothetical protein
MGQCSWVVTRTLFPNLVLEFLLGLLVAAHREAVGSRGAGDLATQDALEP